MRIGLYNTRHKRRYLVLIAVYSRESFSEYLAPYTCLIYSQLFGWKFVSVHCILTVTQKLIQRP